MQPLDGTMNYGQVLAEIDANEKIIARMEEALARGADWLCSNLAPNGPITGEKRVSFCHKVSWGLYEAGRIDECFRILDWLASEARRAPAEYYFDGEPAFDKDMQRIYRFLTFGKVAEWLRHDGIANDEEREGACRYQHSSGGVFANIDNGKEGALEPLNTSFFGQYALAAGMMDRAIDVGEWLCELVEMNEQYLKQDQPVFYYKRDSESGELIIDFTADQEMNFIIKPDKIKQPSWVPGTIVSILMILYRETGGQRYLDASLKLADYEAKTDYAQLYWPSKCKAAWGFADLYAITGDPLHRRLSGDVNRVTFLSAQKTEGAWDGMYYPLAEDGPWRKVVYQGPNKNVPESLPEDGSWGWLSGYEITGEFMGEMGTSIKRFREVLARLRRRKSDLENELQLAD